jgi:hypothetical protein
MTASLETLVIAAYVFADSLRIPRPGPAGKITDQELIAIAVAQAATGLCSDRQFLGVIARLLPGWFAHLPDQSQYNRRLRRLTPYITSVQLMVAQLIAEGRVRLADGTLLSCAKLPRLRQPEPLRRPRELRLFAVQEPVRVGHAAGGGQRPQRRPGRL